MYHIIIEQKVSKEIVNLPRNVIQNILEAVESLKIDPRPVSVKKLVEKDGWRIRVGVYRILYTIDDKKKLVIIYRVKHRKDAYR